MKYNVFWEGKDRYYNYTIGKLTIMVFSDRNQDGLYSRSDSVDVSLFVSRKILRRYSYTLKRAYAERTWLYLGTDKRISINSMAGRH